MNKVGSLVAVCGLAAVVTLVSSCSRRDGSTADRADSSRHGGIAAAVDSLTYEQRQGATLYRTYCNVCHGEEGKGDGFNAYNLDPKPRDFTDSTTMSRLTDERILQTITGGGRSVNRSPLMPSWGGRLAPGEIRYLLAYVRLFGAPRHSPGAE